MSDVAQQAKETLDTVIAHSGSLQEAIGKLSTFMADLAHQYGPDLINLVYLVARLEAAQTLFLSFVGLVFCVFAYRIAKKNFKTADTRVQEHPSPYKDATDFKEFWFALVVSISGLGVGIPSFINFFDIWAWVTLFNPLVGIVGRHIVQFL